MRHISMTALIAAGIISSAGAMAGPIPLPSGPLYAQYSSAEQFSSNNDICGTSVCAAGQQGEGNWGIFQLSILQQGTVLSPTGSDIQGGGNTVFFNGNPQHSQILGIWYDVQNAGLVNGAERSTGGVMDLYWWNNNNQNVGTELSNAANLAKRTAQNEYTGFTCASGNTANCTFLAQLDFVGGADPSNYAYTIASSVDPASSDGTSKSYLNIDPNVVGAWTSILDSNFFTLDPNNVPFALAGLDPRDVRLDNNFTHNGAGAWSVAGTDIVGLRDNDPARLARIPEPGTLALAGVALLALAFTRRRYQGNI
jgi:hypothetical protein